MSDKYSKLILTKLLLVQAVILCLFVGGDVATDKATIIEDDGVIKTIVRRDQFKREWVEYAFHAPKKGLPVPLLELFCSSVKLRLYLKGYRRQVKQTHRKGIYLRRMARFAKHVFKDVRDVDKPFNATMLSKVDKHFMAEFDQSKSSPYDDYDDDDNFDHDEDGQPDDSILRPKKTKMGFKGRVKKMMHVLHKPKHSDSVSDEIIEEIESNETAKKLTKFASKSLKHAALFLYTRWRVMWWLTLSCLYTKYYLWDPALDEFIKLKRSLLTWPDLQLVKLQDLRCKPIRFFMRIMDICKILNPLMKVDLGQFNYDSLTRFKNDSK